jgi:hypothetical protein
VVENWGAIAGGLGSGALLGSAGAGGAGGAGGVSGVGGGSGAGGIWANLLVVLPTVDGAIFNSPACAIFNGIQVAITLVSEVVTAKKFNNLYIILTLVTKFRLIVINKNY